MFAVNHSFDQFPDELLVHMLAHATPGSVVAMSGVSRRFCRLASDDRLWNSLVICLLGIKHANLFHPLVNNVFTWKEAYRFRFLPSLISAHDTGPSKRAKANNPGPFRFGTPPEVVSISRPAEWIKKPEVVDKDTTFRIVNCTSVEMIDGEGKHTILEGEPGTLLTHLSHDGKHLYAFTLNCKVFQWDIETRKYETIYTTVFPPEFFLPDNNGIMPMAIDFLSRDGRIVILWQSDTHAEAGIVSSSLEILDFNSRTRTIAKIPLARRRANSKISIENGKLCIPLHISAGTFSGKTRICSIEDTYVCDWKTLVPEKNPPKLSSVVAIAYKTDRIIGYSGDALCVLGLTDGLEQLSWPAGNADQHYMGIPREQTCAVSGNLVFENVRSITTDEKTVQVFDMNTARTIGSVSISKRAVSAVLAELIGIVSSPSPSAHHMSQNQTLSEMRALHISRVVAQAKWHPDAFPRVFKNGVLFSVENRCDVVREGVERIKATFRGKPGTELTHLAHDGTSLYTLRSDDVVVRWNPDTGDNEEILCLGPSKRMFFLAEDGFIVTASSDYIEIFNTKTKDFRIIDGGIKLNPNRTCMFIREGKLYRTETTEGDSRFPVGEMWVLNLTTGTPEPVIKVPLKRYPKYYKRNTNNREAFPGIRSCRLMDNNCILFATQFESILMDLQGRELVRMDIDHEEVKNIIGILGTLALIADPGGWVRIYDIKTSRLLFTDNSYLLQKNLDRFSRDNQHLIHAELSVNPNPFIGEQVKQATVIQRIYGWLLDRQKLRDPS